MGGEGSEHAPLKGKKDGERNKGVHDKTRIPSGVARGCRGRVKGGVGKGFGGGLW